MATGSDIPSTKLRKSEDKTFFQIGLRITKFLLQEKYDKIWNAATSKWMRAGLSTGIPILCSLINHNFRFLSRILKISFILM